MLAKTFSSLHNRNHIQYENILNFFDCVFNLKQLFEPDDNE